MAENSGALTVDNPPVLDILDTSGQPSLSSTSDMPVIETKPDAQNEGKPPELNTSAPPDEGEAKDPEDSDTSPDDSTSESDPPKKARGVQKRLDELTRQREEASARAQAAEERLDKLLKTLEAATGSSEAAKATAEADPEPVRPESTRFTDPVEFEKALIDYADQKAAWTAKQEIKAYEARQKEQAELDQVASQQAQVRDAYQARVTQAKAKYADFSEVAENPNVPVSPAVALIIMTREDGPDIQYQLGKHADEAKRIAALPVPLQLIEVGRIAARLEAPVTETKPVVSQAPKPVKPLSANNGSVNKDPSNMSMDEYATYRRAQWAQENRRH